MLRTTFLSVFIFLLFISNSYALNNANLGRLTELMILGCSLGKDVVLRINVDGSLMFFKKGKQGNFKTKKSEIPNIINFLTSDFTNKEQANDIRKCTMHYMNKIFDEIIDTSIIKPTKYLKNSDGVVMKLLSCNRKARNEVVCKFDLISKFRDRNITIKSNAREDSSQLFDNASNRYIPNDIQIANHNSHNNSNLNNVPIDANVKADFKLVFKNFSTQAKSIPLLKVGTIIKVDDKVTNEFFDFHDIKIE